MAVAIAGSQSGTTTGVARFHTALATARDAARFRAIPVDCWDAAAGTWRPTSIMGAAGAHVEVLVPIDDVVGVARVDIEQLRLSCVDSDAIDRFWRVRQHLRLVSEIAATLAHANASLRTMTHALRVAEAEARDVWLTVYAHGVPVRLRDAGRDSRLRAVRVVNDVWSSQQRECIEPDREVDDAQVCARAQAMVESELRRLREVLAEAGLSDAAIAAHPLIKPLVALQETAAAPFARTHASPRLDPVVWGFTARGA